MHSLNLEFETKARRQRVKPKERPTRRMRGSDADDEDVAKQNNVKLDLLSSKL